MTDDCIFCAIAAGSAPATVIDADGINLVNACQAAALQTVWHLHVHVVPRYIDDPLQLPWVPERADPAELAAVARDLS